MAEKITINPITGKFNLIADTAQVEADIDQLKTNLVGKKTPEGGEIFNNYNPGNKAGNGAHAEGNGTQAYGNFSHAEGKGSIAGDPNDTNKGLCAHAEGEACRASGQASHAEGYETVSTAFCSHTEGLNTIVNSEFSHAEGKETEIKDTYSKGSHVEGYQSYITDSSQYSHVEGYKCCAIGSSQYSHVEGYKSTANGAMYSHVEGNSTANGAMYSHVEGNSTANGGAVYAHAEGNSTVNGYCAHAEGNLTTVNAYASHVEGDNNIINSGSSSHVEGSYNSLENHTSSHVEGYKNKVDSLSYSHVEGSENTVSSNNDCHVEGKKNELIATSYAHIEGSENRLYASASSHIEGYKNTVENGSENSHAEGIENILTSAPITHIEGQGNISNNVNQHILGKYNQPEASVGVYGNFIEIVGNGQDANNRSNARTLDWNGNQWVAGKHTQEGTPTDPKDLTTKAYVDNLVSTIQGFKVLVVEALPTADIDEHAIYLVPKAGSTPDNYDEYLYTAGAWEHIGNTDIDLSQYATTADLQNAILQEASNRTTAIATAINSEATARQQADTEILQNVETLQTQVNQLNPTRFFGFSNFHNSYTNTYVKIATLKITAETSTGTPHHGEALAHVKLLCYNSFAYSMETTPEVKSVDFDLKAVFVHAHRDTYLTLKINSIQGLGADAVQFICVDLPPQPQNPVGNNNQLPNPATYIILAKCEKPYDRYFYNIQANTNCEGIELLPETEEQPTLTWYDYINNSNYRKAVVKLPQTPLYNFRSSTNLNNGQTETTFGGCNTPEKHFIFYNGTLLSSYYYEYQNNKYSPDTCTFTIKNRTVNEGDKLTVIY